MLEVRDLTVRYGTGRDGVTAVEQASIAVPRGGTLGLVGESGSGKSTLARAVVGLAPMIGGSILLDGVDHSSEKARRSTAYRRRVQMVFQDPYSSLNPRMSTGEVLNEALKQRGMSERAPRRAEALRILDLVGLSISALGRYPHQFSGGQRQRIAIARALALEPEVIIMDEVTSALDVSVQATILNLLKELQRELGLSYLFIAHDLAVVGTMSDVIAVMYLARIVETACADAVLSHPRHPYAQALIASVPRIAVERKPAPLSGDVPDPRNPPPGCRFHTRCPEGPLANPERTICVSIDPQASAREHDHCAACHFAPKVAPENELVHSPR